MTMQITLPKQLEERLRQEAKRRGQKEETVALGVLDQHLPAAQTELAGVPGWPGYPAAGSCKGAIWMADDFEAPLEELREYME
jgi:hypothetical protein